MKVQCATRGNLGVSRCGCIRACYALLARLVEEEPGIGGGGRGGGEEEEEEERINDGEKPKTTAAEGGGPRQDRESKRECYKIGREIGRQGYIRWDGRGRGRGGGGGRGRGGEGRRLWLLRNYCI